MALAQGSGKHCAEDFPDGVLVIVCGPQRQPQESGLHQGRRIKQFRRRLQVLRCEFAVALDGQEIARDLALPERYAEPHAGLQIGHQRGVQPGGW
jgi:hypothetical protein